MMNRGQPNISTGSGLSAMGGALLLIFFVTPWLTACGITFTGKDLAFGLDTGLGGSTQAVYPWLVLIPIIGAAAILLAVLNLNQGPQTVKNRALWVALGGGLAVALLIIVGLGLLDSTNRTQNSLVSSRIEYGYFGSLLGAALILVGGLLDLGVRLPTPGLGGQFGPPQPRPDRVAPPAQTGVRLIFESGPLAGNKIRLPPGDTLIGRASDCDIVISDSKVSRRHAMIRYGEGAWFIQDQDSARGILVNGRSVRAIRLNPGDRIQIGESVIVFQTEN